MPSRRWLALAVLCVALLMLNLDTTVLNVALPSLARDLQATSSQLQWIVDAYVIVLAGLLLAAGSLADRVGRKRTFIVGLLAFAAGSAWAAFSGSVGILIAARASMGIGAALMMPSSLSIVTDIFRDPGERQRAIGAWAGTSGAGIALGPLIGGLLLTRFWWGSVFLINVPVAGTGAACAIVLVPDSKNPATQRPDARGALLSVIALGLIVWTIIEGPVRGWSSVLVTGSGAAGVVALATFAIWERACAHPILNLEFFRSRQFSAAVASVGLVMFGLSGSLFLLTQFLQSGLGFSALQAGLRVLPAAGAVAVVSPASAVAVRRVGAKLTAATGLLLVAAGLWQISGTAADAGYAAIIPGIIMMGIGSGLVIPVATASVMGSVPSGHTGVASATNGTFLQVGSALGVAVIGSLLSARYQDHVNAALAAHHLPPAIERTILGSVSGAQAIASRMGGSAGELITHLARPAFISGMDLGMRVGAAVVLAGALLALAALPARPPAGPDPG